MVDKLLLNDGSSFVLLNDGTSVVLLNGAVVAPAGFTLSGQHATPLLDGQRPALLIPVEFTFILKASILNKFESVLRLKCPIRVEVKSNIKLKSHLLTESRSPFQFKCSMLIPVVAEKSEFLATLPIANALNAIIKKLSNTEQKRYRQHWDKVQEAEKNKLRRSLLSKLFDELNDDE